MPSKIQVLKKQDKIGAEQLNPILISARNRIESSIIKYTNKKNFGTAALVRDNLYKEIKNTYVSLNGSLEKWEASRVKSVAREWRKLAIDDLPKGSYNQTWNQFSKKYVNDMVQRVGPTNAPKLAAVRSSLGGMLDNDIRLLRSSVVSTIREASLTGMTGPQTSRAMRDKILATKPDWQFVDKSGRKWDTNKYFKMVNKTIAANTARNSYVDTMTEAGFDLAMISAHGDSCDTCQSWNGKIISVTGNTPGYPTLDSAYGDGMFHPSCACTLETLLPSELEIEKEKAEAEETE